MSAKCIPVPNFVGETIALKKTKFFFLFCPNHSGTTVLSQYLASQIDGYLPPFENNEGQMVPEVKGMMRNRPWAADQSFDWSYIRQCWERLAKAQTFVEASPPNLIRIEGIRAVFGFDSSAIVSVCNPYQHISSVYRRNPSVLHKGTKVWIRKAREIIRIRQSYPFFPFISYEEFVARPTVLNERLQVPFKEAVISGKRGSGISGIKSGFYRGLGFLKPDEVRDISALLDEASDVMAYFGYALSGPEILEAARERAPEEFQIGIEKRAQWDRRLSANRDG